MAVRAITVQDASVRTMTVEIKSLIVSGKQMTLAVFRQLPLRELIDRDRGELRGLPWGSVNYHWGDMDRDALHVVWQDEETLFRSLVPRAFTWTDAQNHREWVIRQLIAMTASAVLLTHILDGSAKGALHEPVVRIVAGDTWVKLSRSFTDTYTMPEPLASLADYAGSSYEAKRQHRWFETADGNRESRLETEEEAKERYTGKRDAKITAARDAIIGGLREHRQFGAGCVADIISTPFNQVNTRAAMREMLEIKDRTDAHMTVMEVAWGEIYDGLCALDQLFIAV
jgi:hypothetical protein